MALQYWCDDCEDMIHPLIRRHLYQFPNSAEEVLLEFMICPLCKEEIYDEEFDRMARERATPV